MKTVSSKDGTKIAFDRLGEGPALILVTGALAMRSDAASLAAKLSQHFTVFTYDRRGRGDSEDAAAQQSLGQYSAECEIDDLNALIGAAGGPAFVFGHSSGAVVALETARSLPDRITKLAVYEPPFIIDDTRPPVPGDFMEYLSELIATDQRGKAVEYFMTQAVGVPPDVVASMRSMPMWDGLVMMAPTLIYDVAILGDTMRGNPLSIQKWASVTVPTLVIDGGESHAFMHNSAEEITRILPHAQHRRLPGQTHGPADEVLIPVLVDFFQG